MKHNNYFPIRVGDQIRWFQNFAVQIVVTGPALGLTAATATALAADANWIIYLLESWLPGTRNWATSCTQVANFAQTGTGTNVVALPGFTPPPLPNGTFAQLPGSLDRIFAAINAIKNDGKCSAAIAVALKIVGTEETAPDLTQAQPPLTATLNGDHVDIVTGWNGNSRYLDAIELQKDVGDGKGFGHVVTLTSVNYQDPVPTGANRQIVAYRASYRLDNQQVGLWSQTATVLIGA